ncbi:esterase/lipase family protein [Bradyrhizobium quebecense]|uniref:DUF7379 domain-containing protein n=2 Tax=Bradyrhizobium quebecense TaxID=2748629 RepID=A0ABS3MTB4_9BRAD|nr:alpha/beta hydrolase [Bradyrhizobium quebecense]UGY02531.1 alpha/beta hydrolase [Bradyrhizobium quebecense]
MSNDRMLAQQLGAVATELGLEGQASSELISAGSKRRRRGFDPKDFNGLATLSLIRDQDALRWCYIHPTRRKIRREGVRRHRPVGANTVFELRIEDTPPNRLLEALDKLDDKLTPARGLRRYDPATGELKRVADGELAKGSVLLLVHGTFSKSDMFTKEFSATPGGQKFIGKATTKYRHILVFDHPTLSVSPWINALDLESELARSGAEGSMDIICHSRGGLVVAWWLRNGKRNVKRVVFVGSPLEGTSLASPARLRSALDLLINVAGTLQTLGTALTFAVPMMSVVTGLSAVVGGILSLGSRSVLLDAGVSVVPGLASQSRVQNNFEIDRLIRYPWSSAPEFYAVVSSFEPEPVKASFWQFWRHFCGIGTQLVGAGADAVFDGPNDLVVDTKAMALICKKAIPTENTLSFATDARVHHCNYFSQSRTTAFLEQAFRL